MYEDDLAYAFRDIAPAAPVHILVIPKEKGALRSFAEIRCLWQCKLVPVRLLLLLFWAWYESVPLASIMTPQADCRSCPRQRRRTSPFSATCCTCTSFRLDRETCRLTTAWVGDQGWCPMLGTYIGDDAPFPMHCNPRLLPFTRL